MRISPISNNYCKSGRKNVSFGKFENEQAKTKMRELIMSEWDRYSEEYRKRPDSGYKESVKRCNDAINFFDTTPYVTVKLKNNVLYAAKNDSAIENHPYKEAFDEMVVKYERNYNDEDFCFASEEAVALYKSEDDFLADFDYYNAPHHMYEDMKLAEIGFMESKRTKQKSSDTEDDLRHSDPSRWAWEYYKN